jgi:hypothetical protein
MNATTTITIISVSSNKYIYIQSIIPRQEIKFYDIESQVVLHDNRLYME